MENGGVEQLNNREPALVLGKKKSKQTNTHTNKQTPPKQTNKQKQNKTEASH